MADDDPGAATPGGAGGAVRRIRDKTKAKDRTRRTQGSPNGDLTTETTARKGGILGVVDGDAF